MNNSVATSFVVHGNYYPHIDGIRALAVIPVVLFHILAILCPGGFAGVDVFFVISGYLITGGILRDLKQDRFTIRNFYYRRIRRIMPAYFAMIAGVLAVGCVLYYAQPLILLGDSVAAGTLFVANLHFWRMGGDYFAPNLHSQALLHLWSLSVEEQFYLFIPLLCAVIWKLRRSLVAPVLALLAVLSLSGAIYAVLHGKQNNAFYFLHFRAWELLAGSLLAMLPAIGKVLDSPGPNSCCGKQKKLISPGFLAAIGLLMVVMTYIFISSKTPFPGLAAVPPVIGTALLLRYGQNGSVSRLLSSRLFVAIGKISYSLYLWHWPVTVFWKYAVYDQLYYYDYLGMFFLSLLLAYLSWKFVELPVRISQAWGIRIAFLFASTGIILLVGLGTACAYYKGWPTILNPEANKVVRPPAPGDPFVMARSLGLIGRACTVIGYESKYIMQHKKELNNRQKEAVDCGCDHQGSIGFYKTQPIVFVVGDSHAGSLRYGLDAVFSEKKISGFFVSVSNADMFDLNVHAAQNALKLLSSMPEVKQVLLVQRWMRSLATTNITSPEHREASYRQIEVFSRQISSMGKQLLIATDIPEYQDSFHELQGRAKIIAPRNTMVLEAASQQTEHQYATTQGEICNRLSRLCHENGAVLVPLHLAFKQNGNYVTVDQQDNKKVILYRDQHHLTKPGSLRAAQFIMPYMFSEDASNK